MLSTLYRRDCTATNPLMIVNGTSSFRTHMKTAVNNRNNLFLANIIVPDATAAEVDYSQWTPMQSGLAVDKQISDNSTYQGTCPSESANDA